MARVAETSIPAVEPRGELSAADSGDGATCTGAVAGRLDRNRTAPYAQVGRVGEEGWPQLVRAKTRIAPWPKVRRVTLTLGYKASNEQFGPRELLELVKHAESRGFEVSGVSDHLQPWRHNGGHAPAVLPWLGAAAASTSRDRPRHERAHADDALPPGDRRPGVRDARLPRARPDLPRRRHRRGDERDADHRRRVPGPQGAAAEDGRGDRGHPQALERGARRLRGRLLQAAPRHDLRPARRAGADLRRAPAGRWRRSSPAASATASSAPAARTRSSTSTCSPTSRRAPRRPAATTSRSGA